MFFLFKPVFNLKRHRFINKMSSESEIISVISRVYDELANTKKEIKMKDALIKTLQKKIKSLTKTNKVLLETNGNERYKQLWKFWKVNTVWLNGCYNVFEKKMFNEMKAIETNTSSSFTKKDLKYMKDDKETPSSPVIPPPPTMSPLPPPKAGKKRPPKLVRQRVLPKLIRKNIKLPRINTTWKDPFNSTENAAGWEIFNRPSYERKQF